MSTEQSSIAEATTGLGLVVVLVAAGQTLIHEFLDVIGLTLSYPSGFTLYVLGIVLPLYVLGIVLLVAGLAASRN